LTTGFVDKSISVLDYGMGNLRSVAKAFESLGATVRLVHEVPKHGRLVIPGVGAFGAAMERIGPLKGEIQAFVEAGNPLLGICLGQQLLFETSEEFGCHEGLGLVAGKVQYFRDLPPGMKVPHMGWTGIKPTDGSLLLRGIELGDHVYFVHSLYTECNHEADIAATCLYGVEFAAAVEKQNVWGAQFHPEKSGAVGLRILRNFLEC
jgi:glutamine amidotransferase